jgi:hypothetical protein
MDVGGYWRQMLNYLDCKEGFVFLRERKMEGEIMQGINCNLASTGLFHIKIIVDMGF